MAETVRLVGHQAAVGLLRLLVMPAQRRFILRQAPLQSTSAQEQQVVRVVMLPTSEALFLPVVVVVAVLLIWQAVMRIVAAQVVVAAETVVDLRHLTLVTVLTRHSATVAGSVTAQLMVHQVEVADTQASVAREDQTLVEPAATVKMSHLGALAAARTTLRRAVAVVVRQQAVPLVQVVWQARRAAQAMRQQRLVRVAAVQLAHRQAVLVRTVKFGSGSRYERADDLRESRGWHGHGRACRRVGFLGR